MFTVLGCATGTGSRHPAQDALRPGQCSARSSRSVRKAHCYQGQAMQREMTVGGWRRVWIAPGQRSVAQAGWPVREGVLRPRAGWRGHSERLVGGWRKTQFGQGVTVPGNWLCKEKWEKERSQSSGHAVSQARRGRPRCNGERPACSRRWRTGACETLRPGQRCRSSSYTAVGDGKVRVAGQLQPKRGTTAKQVSRSAR